MTAEAIIQGGNLVLLAFVLGGLYRLVLRTLPLVERLVTVLARLDEGLEELTGKVDALDGRGVCPVLQARELEERRATEPEVLP